LKKVKFAFPTDGDKGLENKVSDVFGRANTFTLVEVEGKKVKNVEVVKNPALTYRSGVGPLVVKMLSERGVDTVVAGEIGPGASTLLEQYKIKKVKVEPKISVGKALETLLTSVK